MPLVKIIRHGQVTLPAHFREVLNIKEGDYLEAELEGNRVVLKPTVVLDRNQAIKQLHQLMDKVQERSRNASEEEIERDVQAAIRAVRRRKRHA